MTPFIIGCALIFAGHIVLLATIFVTYMIGAWLAHSKPRRKKPRREKRRQRK